VVISNYCWIQRIVLSVKGFIVVLLFLVRWPLLILTGFWYLRASLAYFIEPIMSKKLIGVVSEDPLESPLPKFEPKDCHRRAPRAVIQVRFGGSF